MISRVDFERVERRDSMALLLIIKRICQNFTIIFEYEHWKIELSTIRKHMPKVMLFEVFIVDVKALREKVWSVKDIFLNNGLWNKSFCAKNLKRRSGMIINYSFI